MFIKQDRTKERYKGQWINVSIVLEDEQELMELIALCSGIREEDFTIAFNRLMKNRPELPFLHPPRKRVMGHRIDKKLSSYEMIELLEYMRNVCSKEREERRAAYYAKKQAEGDDFVSVEEYYDEDDKSHNYDKHEIKEQTTEEASDE